MSFLKAYRNTYVEAQEMRKAINNRIGGLEREYGEGPEVQTLKEDVRPPIVKLEEASKELMADALHTKPIWQYYLKHIKGMGDSLAGKLVGGGLSPEPTRKICNKCGAVNNKPDKECHQCEADIKEDGFHYEKRPDEVPHPSCFPAYCGVIPGKDGKPLTRTQGEQASYNTTYKDLLLGDRLIVASMMSQTGEYYDWYQKYRNESETKDPDWPDGKHDRKARRKVAQLFLNHLWTVWRKLRGLDTNKPYINAKENHTYIPPFVEVDGEVRNWEEWMESQGVEVEEIEEVVA